jgi:hypothetical protein
MVGTPFIGAGPIASQLYNPTDQRLARRKCPRQWGFAATLAPVNFIGFNADRARTIPFASAFRESEAGRLLRCRFRGLLSVYSRYGLHARRVAYATFYTEGFSSFVASAAASIATGWSEPVPGRDFSPAEDQRLFTAHSDNATLIGT